MSASRSPASRARFAVSSFVIGLLISTASYVASPAVLAEPSCVGNCGGEARVTLDDLVRGVGITLGQLSLDDCRGFDVNADGRVTTDELVAAVEDALNGCAIKEATPTPSGLPTASVSATSAPTDTMLSTPTATPVLPTAVPTVSPTVPMVDSVCGGLVTSQPKLCDLTVMPNPVSQSEPFTVRYGISDLEGNVDQFCISYTPAGTPPTFTCFGSQPAGSLVNEFVQIGPVPADFPLGTYTVAVEVSDPEFTSDTIQTNFVVQ
jgi:hypothetical protein